LRPTKAPASLNGTGAALLQPFRPALSGWSWGRGLIKVIGFTSGVGVMAERSNAIRSGRIPPLWAWVRIPLTSLFLHSTHHAFVFLPSPTAIAMARPTRPFPARGHRVQGAMWHFRFALADAGADPIPGCYGRPTIMLLTAIQLSSPRSSSDQPVVFQTAPPAAAHAIRLSAILTRSTFSLTMLWPSAGCGGRGSATEKPRAAVAPVG